MTSNSVEAFPSFPGSITPHVPLRQENALNMDKRPTTSMSLETFLIPIALTRVPLVLESLLERCSLCPSRQLVTLGNVALGIAGTVDTLHECHNTRGHPTILPLRTW